MVAGTSRARTTVASISPIHGRCASTESSRSTVFGHLDPRIIESGALFRQTFTDQARLLGLSEELPRLRTLIDECLAGR